MKHCRRRKSLKCFSKKSRIINGCGFSIRFRLQQFRVMTCQMRLLLYNLFLLFSIFKSRKYRFFQDYLAFTRRQIRISLRKFISTDGNSLLKSTFNLLLLIKDTPTVPLTQISQNQIYFILPSPQIPKSMVYRFRQQYMVQYKTRVFLLTFFSYVGVHSIRTSYSFSKKMIASTIEVDDTQLALVDSLLLYGLAIGYLQLTFFPFSKPLLTLFIGLLLVAVFYILVPFFVTFIETQSFVILCLLMTIDGYFQSWTWPHLLMLINSQYDNKKEGIKLGLWTTCTNFGNILGFVICQFLVLSNGLPWQLSMLVVGGYIVLMAFLSYCLMDEIPIAKNNQNKQENEGISNNQSLITESKSQTEDRLQYDISHSSNKQNLIRIIKQPVVILITIAFSLVKSIEFGILFWLPLYFDIIGLVQYSAYIPIAFDSASVVSSIALGYAFTKINNKGLLLAPLIFLLMICFALLRYINASVGLYFVLVAGVGLFLGGSYNTLCSLVTIQLVKVMPPHLRTKYLGVYTSVLMCFANLITASFQLVIGVQMRNDESLIFVIFFWLGAIILILLIIVGVLEKAASPKSGELVTEQQIEIVGTH